MRVLTTPPFYVAAALAFADRLLASTPGGIPSPAIAGFSGATTHPSKGGLAVCVSGTVPVTAMTSQNLKFNFSLPANQSQVTETFLEYTMSGSVFLQSIMAGAQTVSGTYNISATLCTPANNTAPTSVQLLTHGLGFDHAYWDFAPGYSYVDAAIQSGHAAFFYDRLGVGLSSKPDPLNVVQAPLELAIVNELISMLRNGDFSNVKFSTVVGVGHSYGSALTEAVTAASPESLDAAILTGYSTNSTGMTSFTSALNLAIASENQPYRFAGLDNGYLVGSTAISNQIGFFRAPGFDPTILSLAASTKGLVAIGELFSSNVIAGVAKNFTGPVAVVNGAEDLPFCFSNCSYPTNLPAQVKMLYPQVSAMNFSTYLAPIAGHGVNLHYSASGAYDFIQGFLKSRGL